MRCRLTVGDVVDIADYWIAVISVDSRMTATLVTKAGEKIPVSSKYETEIAPTEGQARVFYRGFRIRSLRQEPGLQHSQYLLLMSDVQCLGCL
jgi:hypothetical protein